MYRTKQIMMKKFCFRKKDGYENFVEDSNNSAKKRENFPFKKISTSTWIFINLAFWRIRKSNEKDILFHPQFRSGLKGIYAPWRDTGEKSNGYVVF